jgi:hypothetical protein
MNPNKGWFSIIQYCPDPNRLESANIGVLLFCPELNFLDVQVASNNQRIIKFFGSNSFEKKLVNSFKKGIGERVEKEKLQIQTYEQLAEFIDRRSNQIRISPPRSLRVTNPAEQLDELFVELVGGPHRREPKLKDRLAESLEQKSIEKKLHRQVSIAVPVDGKQLSVPYAFQNGRFNLIQPVRFQSENPLQTAYRYAVEGDSIYESANDRYGKMKLLVVGKFRSNTDEHRSTVEKVLKHHHVDLFSMDELDKLVHEILVTGKDRKPKIDV